MARSGVARVKDQGQAAAALAPDRTATERGPGMNDAPAGAATRILAPLHDAPQARRITLPRIATIIVAAAVLYLAKDVFLPLSIAMLITFALSPLVTRLRRLGLPKLLTVIAVVTAAFAVIALFLLVVAGQLTTLAQNLPAFQANILTKVDTLSDADDPNGIAARLSRMVAAINSEIGAALPAGDGDAAAPQVETRPLPVEVVEPQSAVGILQDLVLPLISPIATSGLVIVVVVFMLLERENLRDRFIRLVGSSDLHRTTQVLEEAGGRVARYLMTQLLVNVIYAVPIGVGLWFIGVPNALLWGLLTLVLRFVPYIGSVLSAAFPLFLAFAVAPGWSAVLWTAALFLAVEFITSNAIEPYLYGSRTGVSPLAIIVAAIAWTWIWGPLGLVLSTPLTVCLVVLGRHIPQFELFDILFGDEPVLAPHSRLYQRLLAGDAMESTFRAEEALEDQYLAEYYQTTAIPALLLAQNDRDRDVLTLAQQERLAAVAMTMVGDLGAVAAEERDEDGEDADGGDPQACGTAEPDFAGDGFRVACVGGRSAIDDVSAAMLAQAMTVEGADAGSRSHEDLSPSRFRTLGTGDRDCLVLCFLDAAPSRTSLLHVRRIKRAAPHLRVGVVIWQMPAGIATSADGLLRFRPVAAEKLEQAKELGADFAVTNLEAAMAAAFTRAEPVAVPPAPKQKLRRPARRSVGIRDRGGPT
jgi:predicted PurR-regulated permease PerM